MWKPFLPAGYPPFAPQQRQQPGSISSPLTRKIESHVSENLGSATAFEDLYAPYTVNNRFTRRVVDDIKLIADRLAEDSEMRRQVISKIIALAKDNLNYFSTVQQQHVKLLSTHDWVFSNLFVKQLDHLDEVGVLVKKVEEIAVHYDPGPLTGCLPANGYRSVLTATDACLERLHRLNERVKHKREDLVFFRRAATQNELSDCTDILVTMRAFLVFCLQIDAAADSFKQMPKFISNPIEKGKLMQQQMLQQNAARHPVEPIKPLIVHQDQAYLDRWLTEIETIDQRCFYGRCAGFQYKQSIERIVTGFLIGMAAYADGIGASTLPQAVRDGSIKLTETIITHHRGQTPPATSPEPKTSKDVPASNPMEAEVELAARGVQVRHGDRTPKSSPPSQPRPIPSSSISNGPQRSKSDVQWKSASLDSAYTNKTSPFKNHNAVPESAGPSSFFSTFFGGFGAAAATTTSPPATDVESTLSTSPTSSNHEPGKKLGFFGSSALLATQLRSTTTSLLSTGKYIMQPDQRAEKICRVTRYGDINCIKGFWNIHENQLGYQLHDMVGPKIKTNNYFQIKHLPLKVRRRNKHTGVDEYILVDPPSSHAPPRPIKVRLLCNYAVDELSDESQFQAGMMTKQTEAANMIMKQQEPSHRTIPPSASRGSNSNRGTKTNGTELIGKPHVVFPGTAVRVDESPTAVYEARKLLTEPHHMEGAASSESIEQVNHMINERRFSDTLIVHFHGGGFVAQSSKTHEIYLRGWAKEFDVPIFSVDYSLAPEYPYPRGFEECFFAYLWAIENAAHLSSSAQRVIVCGDSAGGNMALAVALKAIEMGLRPPDSIMAVYPALLIKYAPSPSRILAMMDPILPLGVLTHCLAAYAGLEWMDPTHSWAQKDQQSPSSSSPSSPTPSLKMTNGAADKSIYDAERYKGLKHEQIMAPRSLPPSPAHLQPPPAGRNAMKNKHPVVLGTIFSGGTDDNSGSSNNTSDAESEVGSAVTSSPQQSAAGSRISSSQQHQPLARGLPRSHSADSALYYDADDEEASTTLAAATAATADGGGGGVTPSIIRQRSSGSATVNAGSREEFLQRRRRAQEAAAANNMQSERESRASLANNNNMKRPLTRLYVDGEPRSTSGAGLHTSGSAEGEQQNQRETVYHDPQINDAVESDRSRAASSTNIPRPHVGAMRRSQSERRNLPDSYRSRISDGITHWRGFDADERKLMEQQQGSRKRLYEDYMQDVKKDYAVSHPTAPWLNMIAPLPRYSFEHVPNDFTLSPLLAPVELLRQLPPTKIFACELDPLLDDAVSFSRKMEYEVGNPISLTVVEGMPHGFLHLAKLSKEAQAGNDMCIQTMKDMIKRTPYYSEQRQHSVKKPLAGVANKLQEDELVTVGGDHREKLKKALESDDSGETKNKTP